MRKKKFLLVLILMCAVVQGAWADEVTTQYANGVFRGFTATAGAGGTGNEGYPKLVDGNTGTKMCTQESNTYIEFHSSGYFVPTGYIMTTANDAQSYPGRNPKNWNIKAKVNQSDDWTTLVAVTNATVPATNNTDKEFTIEGNTTAYKYFRLEVYDLEYTFPWFQLSEFRFKGTTNDINFATTDLNDSYDLTSAPLNITPDVELDGTDLALGTDYTATLNGTPVASFPITINASDIYTLTITGKGGYTSSKSIKFNVFTELSGTGNSESDAILINSSADWITFANRVNGGESFANKYVKLTANIDAVTPVGTRISDSNNKPFSGTFLGNSKVITAKLSDDGSSGLAPFRYISGATIKNLTVAGTITSGQYHTAGVVGFADGTNNLIEGCTVMATLNISSNYAGGIIGHGQSSSTTIKSCIFAGIINGVGGDRANIGGIWGWSDTGTPTLENCLERGTYNNISSMHPMGLQGSKGTINNCYFLNPQKGSPSNACTVSGAGQAYTSAPANEISKKVEFADGNYFAPCTFSSIENTYNLSGTVNISPVLTNVDGTTASINTDYTAQLNGNDLNALPISITTKGDYTLTLTGTGNYAGEKSITFYVLGTLSGTGDSENDAYAISSSADWITFANRVNGDESFANKYVKLTADIDAVTPVGTDTDNKPFSGTFLGNGKVITAKLSDDGSSGLAPFRYISGATIKNLTIAGSISSNQRHTAGLVGFADGTNMIEDCMVKPVINIGNDYAGGIIGHGLTSTTTIRNCVFAGTFNGKELSQYMGSGWTNYWKTKNIGGIWGWSDSGNPTLENCIEKGTYNTIGSMHPMGLQGGSGTITNCYFVNPQYNSPDNACTAEGTYYRAYGSAPEGVIYKEFTVLNTTVYSLACVVSSVAESYTTENGTTSVQPVVADPYSQQELSFGTDFTAKLNDVSVASLPHSISQKGNYTLTLTGEGNYFGSMTFHFLVVGPDDDIPVTSYTTEMTNGTYKVYQDKTIPSRINIIGDVVLNLGEGTTLTAPKGIEVSSDNNAKLTINGPGALNIITNGDVHTNKSGIGALKYGDITINGGNIHVNVYGVGATSSGGAAIGGDYAYQQTGSAGTITINGGVIYARGAFESAGIGGGDYSYCGDITINGGQITADGGIGSTDGAGIGPASQSKGCGTLTLNWTSPDDYIYCSGYKNNYGNSWGNIVIAPGKGFIIDDGQEIVVVEDDIKDLIYQKIKPYYHAENCVLKDNDTYTNTGLLNVISATYRKTLGEERVGKYQAWFVPFNYTIKEADTQKFDFYKINMIANTPDPATNAGDDIWVFLKKVDAGTVLHANMPYVYKPKEAVTDYEFTADDNILRAKETGVLATMQTMEDTYTLYGTYEPTTATAVDPFYYINTSGTMSLGNDGTVTVGAFRWIMRKASKFGGSSSAAYAPTIRFFDGDENGATGIDSVNGSEVTANGSSAYYDLQGRKVEQPKKGLYIRNGRKVIVK